MLFLHHQLYSYETMAEINLKINLSYGDNDFLESTSVSRSSYLVQFLCWGIFLPIVALVGVVGNALTIVVLWRREMQSTTILYLRGLVITDTGKNPNFFDSEFRYPLRQFASTVGP